MKKNFLVSHTIKKSISFVCISYLVFFSSLFLEGGTARQNLTFAYFEQTTHNIRIPYAPNFVKGAKSEEISKGILFTYERKVLDFMDLAACYLGGSVGKWEKGEEFIYSGTFFFAPRFWVFHFGPFHPFLEGSLFGPTFLSEGSFASLLPGSRFLFQNYISAGVEVGGMGGLVFDVKILRYYRADLTRPKEGFLVPLLLSCGLSF